MAEHPIPAGLEGIYAYAKRVADIDAVERAKGLKGVKAQITPQQVVDLIERIARVEAKRGLVDRFAEAQNLLVLATTMPGCVLDVDVADRIAAFLAESEVRS